MTYNPLKRLRALSPSHPREYATVTSITPSGSVVAQRPDGITVNVIGTAAVGDHVFYKDTTIEGPAPTISTFVEQEE